MKERQRWRSEEDALLCAYVKQYGPREWNLVAQRMNKPLDRDAKSCLERWKNYLKPGIKKGSLTEEEQRLVIKLQAKHGNKWKKIAAEIPGRTAKRLGKWWEVFKEKQRRQQQKGSGKVDPIDEGKYDQILQTFAEKLVQGRFPSGPKVGVLADRVQPICMATSNSFHHSDPQSASQMLPPWLSNSNGSSTIQPPSPSVALTLSHSTGGTMPWLQPVRIDNGLGLRVPRGPVSNVDSQVISGLAEHWKELEEGHQALLAHKKEAAWRLKRVELQLESEKVSRRREKMEEIDSKVRALWEEQKVLLERLDAEYKEQIMSLRRDAELKEQKLAEQWAGKHQRLVRFLEQIGCPQPGGSEQTGR